MNELAFCHFTVSFTSARFLLSKNLKSIKMPAAEVETTFTTSVVEKEVEAIPEKGETNCEGKACEETKTDESMKTMEESEKMEKEKFPETENKDESNTLSGNEEKPACESEVMVEKSLEDKPTQETEGKMAENSKRKSTEASNQTQEEDSPPKKRKST